IMKYYRYPGNKIFVTHPAVDDRYFGLTSSKDAKKTVAGIIGEDFPFILHLSSLQPRKNVPLIVAAFARLKESNGSSLAKQNDLKLVIVGDRSGYNYDKKIEEEIANQIRNGNLKKGDVIITGYQPKEILPYFYKAAKIFVFPSVYEGFGIPLLEAMVSKTPVIASNIGSLKEVGGKAPIYINLEDEERADKIREAMEDLLENDARKAKKISLGLEQAKRFSWKKLAEKTMEVYESILSV
ncbi:MAG: glycosyltransferase family 4 protein, partial [Candidatus Moranbacteria bacterium]|nr:glycosyltransferase family 4 protein [Candidatus Moranbacteria bacterium]